MSESTAKEKFSFIEMLGAHPGKFALSGFVAVVLVWGFYLGQFRFGLSDSQGFWGQFGLSGSQETWGQFGDFVGGTLNSVFGFLGFLILLSSLRLQAKELEETRKELKASTEAQTKHANRIEEESKRKRHIESIQFIINELPTGRLWVADVMQHGNRTTADLRQCKKSEFDIDEKSTIYSEINYDLSISIGYLLHLDHHLYLLHKAQNDHPIIIKSHRRFAKIIRDIGRNGWIDESKLRYFGKINMTTSVSD